MSEPFVSAPVASDCPQGTSSAAAWRQPPVGPHCAPAQYVSHDVLPSFPGLSKVWPLLLQVHVSRAPFEK
jgi:hypothetical protein